jgi:hypothetical protein
MTAGFLKMATLSERRYPQKTKRLQTPAKRRMKASNESRRKSFGRLAPSFSLTEKWLRERSEPDEHSQTGILTSASNLIPPSRSVNETVALEFVAVTVAQPLRTFTGFPDI